jgi:hypothetical protein
MTLKAYAPNGRPIIGTSDLIPGCALGAVFKEAPDGELQVEFEGETRVYWDGQYQVTDDEGRELYQDDDGGEWPESELVFLDEDDLETPNTLRELRRAWADKEISHAS